VSPRIFFEVLLNGEGEAMEGRLLTFLTKEVALNQSGATLTRQMKIGRAQIRG